MAFFQMSHTRRLFFSCVTLDVSCCQNQGTLKMDPPQKTAGHNRNDTRVMSVSLPPEEKNVCRY